MSREAVVGMAKRLLRLHDKPYDSETCDEDNLIFEELALKLARAVLALPSPAAALGRIGGKVTSPEKAAAVRENGKLGGRPRKS